jgi:hypothetical protein
MDLSTSKVKVDIVERLNPGKTLADVPYGQKIVGHESPLTRSIVGTRPAGCVLFAVVVQGTARNNRAAPCLVG